MEGVNDPPELKGIIPRAFAEVFDQIAVQGGAQVRVGRTLRGGRGAPAAARPPTVCARTPQVEFLVRASYLEIYNEEIRDLLSKNPHNRVRLTPTLARTTGRVHR